MHAKFPEAKASPIIPTVDDKSTFDGAERHNTVMFLLHLWIHKLVGYVNPDDVVVNLCGPGVLQGHESPERHSWRFQGRHLGHEVDGRTVY